MRRLKFSSSSVLLLVFLSLFGAEGWLLLRERQQAVRATRDLARKMTERDWLAQQAPGVTEQNEQAIASELADARRALAGQREALLEGEAGWLNARPPAKPIDAFFDLAGFVEKTRAAAAQVRIGLAADEHFGFAAYATVGPAPEFIPGVYRQRLAAQRLLGALIEAHPLSLLAFRLEAPAAAAPVGKDISTDYFSFNPALSLRQSRQLGTLAFRLEFSGQTPVLRDFLNRVAALTPAFVVRSVEVEPLLDPAATEQNTASLLVRQNSSKFAVIVELVLPDAPPAPS